MLARVRAELGDHAGARALLNEVVARLPEEHDEPSSRSCVAQLVRAVALLGATEEAEALIDRVSSFRGRIFLRTLWGAFGTAEHHLGAAGFDRAPAPRHRPARRSQF